MKFLLETDKSFIESYGLLIALAVILIVMIVMSYIRNKKLRDDANTLLEGLKVGDDVKTYSGICGKIVAFGEVDGVRTAVIACNHKDYAGAFEIDVNAIYCKTGVLPQEPVAEKPVAEPVKEEPIVDNTVEETQEKPKSKKSKK